MTLVGDCNDTNSSRCHILQKFLGYLPNSVSTADLTSKLDKLCVVKIHKNSKSN
jgi:hypothetical protein